jgi:hypothetical protein
LEDYGPTAELFPAVVKAFFPEAPKGVTVESKREKAFDGILLEAADADQE